MAKPIPLDIKKALQEVATEYSESEATTNAGVVLRIIAKIIPVETIIQLFAHVLKKQ